VHVVIVGGGFGGLYAARALRKAPVEVTLVDRRNHHLFQPLLYQVATAALSPGDIASPIRWILRHQRNVEVLLADVRRVEPERRTLVLADGELTYDFLIVAAGATHAYFGNDEWRRVAHGLKTLEDALEIRRRVLLAYERAEREPDAARRQALLTFVVIGGGPTGVELAGALAEISRQSLARDFRHFDPGSARIILVEAGPVLLAAFPETLRDAARKRDRTHPHPEAEPGEPEREEVIAFPSLAVRGVGKHAVAERRPGFEVEVEHHPEGGGRHEDQERRPASPVAAQVPSAPENA